MDGEEELGILVVGLYFFFNQSPVKIQSSQSSGKSVCLFVSIHLKPKSIAFYIDVRVWYNALLFKL